MRFAAAVLIGMVAFAACSSDSARHRYSSAELDAFVARIDESVTAVTARGVQLVSWGADPATNSIAIGVASDLDIARRVIPEVVGTDVPIVVHAEAPVVT